MAKGYTPRQSGQDVQVLGADLIYRFNTLCEVCTYNFLVLLTS